MTKKIIPLSDYIGASDASQILSLKLGRPVSSEYIRKLSKRKKRPVRTQQMGNRLLYLKADILACTIKQKMIQSE